MSEREPITAELREAVEWEPTFCGPDKAMVPQPEFDRLCDAIDAVHAQLERENAELRERLAALDKRSESMHIGGSITNELRKFIEDPLLGYAPQDQHIELLTKIADRIDAEHEALRDQLETSERQKESYREDLLAANRQVHASYNDGFDEGFASADDWLAQHEDAMAEHGWYRALDPDGVPTRIGDKMDSDHYEDGTVTGVQFYEMANGGIRTLIAVRPDGWDVPTWHTPDEYRHHHAPTVEDVMVEFATDWECAQDGEDKAAVLKEYAAKLRLAGDAE